ncbi:MAG TPA: chemotaxis protein CheW [Terriglobales bacterium]|nr:chemotaxis protein CheW [Terriglobales bacterium]
MRLTRPEARKRSARRGEAVILFSVAGTSFAVAVSAVEEIRSTEGLRPAPPGFAGSRLPKVKYLMERERKTYFVVDSNLHFHILPSRATRVLILRHAPVAILVDNIEKTSEITALHALPRAFEGEEQQWYRGIALFGEQVVPLVRPEAFLSKGEVAVAQAGASKLAAAAEGPAPGAASA